MQTPEYFRDYREKRRARGICAECPTRSYGYRCQVCAERHRARKKGRKQVPKAA